MHKANKDIAGDFPANDMAASEIKPNFTPF